MKFASDVLQQEIKTKIERMFDLVRLHLLGVEGRDKIEPEHIKNFKFADTLKGMYMHAHSMHHTPDTFDKDLLEKTIKVAGEYIDKAEQQATADVMRIIGASLDGVTIKAKMLGQSERDVLLSPEGKQIVKQLTVQLGDQFDKVVTATEKIVAAETIGAQNMGQISGIMGASKALGIEDPTVLKYGVIDERLTDQCRHLWHTEGNIEKPKVYKLSELKPGYGDPKKEWVPTLNLSHFGCRHVLTFLLPGFGLDDSGKIVYKGTDPQTGLPHDEHSAQRKK